MRSHLPGPALAAVASLLWSASAAALQTCQNPPNAFNKDTLSPGCCTSWITKRDLGAVPLPSLAGRADGDCPTATCCETKKTLFKLDKTGSDLQCGAKFDNPSSDGDTTKGVQYSLGPCAANASKTCLSITVTPVKSDGCYALASAGISVFINDGTVPPDTSSGNWNFANAQSQYCTLKTGASGCQYWSCDFEQSLWYSKIKTPGTDGICGNTIAVGVHIGIDGGTCTQGRTGFGYGGSFFQYEKITVSCTDVCDTASLCCCPCNSETHCCPGDTYCGGDGKAPNPLCPAQCCPGQTRCDSPLCNNNPTPNCCTATENYCGTGGKKMNKECEPECCEGDTRCNNSACTGPEPLCCPEKENYCGTGGLLLNKQCAPECCEGDTRCNNPACTGSEPLCCPEKENYCGTGGLLLNKQCAPECCDGDTRCNNPACTTGPDCCPEKENYCGTGGLEVNKKCTAECCTGDNRCNNPACTGPDPACCPDKESYCGDASHIKNTNCEPTCCGGTCCDDILCCNPPSDRDFCPQPQCQYGTGWGWLKPAVDDTNHFVNKLKLCPSSRWGEWFDITSGSLPFTGDLVVGRGDNSVSKGDIVGTVSLSQNTDTTVKACFDLTKTTAHIASVHVEVSCNPFDSTAYSSTKKKGFNICAPGQWLYKFPPAGGCLDWVSSQHNICIKDIPTCSGGHYYAIFHAAVTKNVEGGCTPSSSCWTDS